LVEFLAWLEGSALGHAMRGAGVWSYGVVNLIHILGVATLFGSILVLDLRLLGLWARVPLVSVATPALPLAVVGFTVAVMSGACLLATNASEYAGNPFLLIKFLGVALGLVNVAVLHALPAWKERAERSPTEHERLWLAAAGGASLVCWLTALAAGRLIGYW
jgi:hypothetical protein